MKLNSFSKSNKRLIGMNSGPLIRLICGKFRPSGRGLFWKRVEGAVEGEKKRETKESLIKKNKTKNKRLLKNTKKKYEKRRRKRAGTQKRQDTSVKLSIRNHFLFFIPFSSFNEMFLVV